LSLRALYDVPAPAKLNLFLHVIGRRPDGYHLLESVFALIDWADTLHFELRTDGVLRRHDLREPLPDDDLCLRAARALQQHSGSTLGVDISIAKCIPSGAGLGGGSSDAATVLLALNRLWGLRWSRARLIDLASSIGADVPFFVFGRNALARGIGERLQACEVVPATYAVLKPEASIATVELFQSPLLRRDTSSLILSGFPGDAEAAVPAADAARLTEGFGVNDLQPAAEACCAEVVQALRLMERTFGNCRMTGSGSAVFSRIGTDVRPEATWPCGVLAPGWVGRLCRSLSGHPLEAWAG
jgi:4-diphosphocytidyl-2-C-methyl-D-erythritol kinase